MDCITLSSPVVFTLELTPVCQNACPGCANVYAHSDTLRPLSASNWHTIIQTNAAEAVRIRLSGGEPTLHPEFLSILDSALSTPAEVTLFTNGRWDAPQELVHQIQSRSRPIGILVSLHGADADAHESFTGISGSFEETVQNIRLVTKAGISTAITTILTQKSIPQIERMVDLANELGVEHVAFNRMVSKPIPGLTPTNAQMRTAVEQITTFALANHPVQFGLNVPQCHAVNPSEGCMAGITSITIDPWGNARPCPFSGVVLGSLRKQSLEAIWNGKKLQNWREKLPGKCTACAALNQCHGGCRALAEISADTIDPLIADSLLEYYPFQPEINLPADAKPVFSARVRKEPFGFLLMSNGSSVPISEEARKVLTACDGNATFSELAGRFGMSALELLGELTLRGMIEYDF